MGSLRLDLNCADKSRTLGKEEKSLMRGVRQNNRKTAESWRAWFEFGFPRALKHVEAFSRGGQRANFCSGVRKGSETKLLLLRFQATL